VELFYDLVFKVCLFNGYVIIAVSDNNIINTYTYESIEVFKCLTKVVLFK
jgi:hypothetical protein